jgi:hypothetical protein
VPKPEARPASADPKGASRSEVDLHRSDAGLRLVVIRRSAAPLLGLADRRSTRSRFAALLSWLPATDGPRPSITSYNQTALRRPVNACADVPSEAPAASRSSFDLLDDGE